MTEFDQPVMTCPQCGVEYKDFDGLGVLYCEKCGFCKHASLTMHENKRWRCDYCGKDMSIDMMRTLSQNIIIEVKAPRHTECCAFRNTAKVCKDSELDK